MCLRWPVESSCTGANAATDTVTADSDNDKATPTASPSRGASDVASARCSSAFGHSFSLLARPFSGSTDRPSYYAL